MPLVGHHGLRQWSVVEIILKVRPFYLRMLSSSTLPPCGIRGWLWWRNDNFMKVLLPSNNDAFIMSVDIWIPPVPTLKYIHDDVIKWKHFPRYWLFVRGIHRSPVNSPQKGQWRGALMFSLICVWINGWVNNCEAGDLRRYLAHYDVTVMR